MRRICVCVSVSLLGAVTALRAQVSTPDVALVTNFAAMDQSPILSVMSSGAVTTPTGAAVLNVAPTPTLITPLSIGSVVVTTPNIEVQTFGTGALTVGPPVPIPLDLTSPIVAIQTFTATGQPTTPAVTTPLSTPNTVTVAVQGTPVIADMAMMELLGPLAGVALTPEQARLFNVLVLKRELELERFDLVNGDRIRKFEIRLAEGLNDLDRRALRVELAQLLDARQELFHRHDLAILERVLTLEQRIARNMELLRRAFRNDLGMVNLTPVQVVQLDRLFEDAAKHGLPAVNLAVDDRLMRRLGEGVFLSVLTPNQRIALAAAHDRRGSGRLLGDNSGPGRGLLGDALHVNRGRGGPEAIRADGGQRGRGGNPVTVQVRRGGMEGFAGRGGNARARGGGGGKGKN